LRAVTSQGKRAKDVLGVGMNDVSDPYQSMYQEAYGKGEKMSRKSVDA